MTEIPAYAVFAVVVPASALLSGLVTRITWLTLSARHVCLPADESCLPPPLPAAVNRQAARSAVRAKGWADTDRNSVPRQLSPAERPVGAHRIEP